MPLEIPFAIALAWAAVIALHASGRGSLVGRPALGVDAVVHRAVEASPWLDARPQLVAVAVPALAGAFQFSSLKDRVPTALSPAVISASTDANAPARPGWATMGRRCLPSPCSS